MSQSAAWSQGGLLQDAAPGTDSTSHRRLTVFSGFVSYDQLEQKLLGSQKKGLPWLPKNVEGPHPVRMRGPGSSSAVLCCAVLCCAVLCCAVLCCAVLCCAVLCGAALRRAALRCAVLQDTTCA